MILESRLEILNNLLKKYRWLFLIYLCIFAVVFGKIFFMKSSISGGDWGFPDNGSQMKVFFDSLLHSWTRLGNIFGARQLGSSLIIFIAPLLLLSKIGIGVSSIMKLFLVLIFALAGSNLNLFIRYIGVKPFPAFIGGLIFTFTPVFFNYSLMGWLYVLLSLALMPLFAYLFLRSVDDKNFIFLIFASIVFTIAGLQSQTLVFYPIIMAVFCLRYLSDKRELLLSIRNSFLILLLFVLLNAFWLLPLLLFPDVGVTGNGLVNSTISVGTSDQLSLLNVIRGWGSLFNNQFEYSYPKFLLPFSFTLTVLAIISLIFTKSRRKDVVPMIILFTISCIFFFIDRDILLKIPFSNVVRDVARFSTLSTFSLVVLATIALDIIFSIKSRLQNLLITTVIIFLLLGACPFYSGSLFEGRVHDRDFRLRTRQWPAEYQELNNKFQKEDKSKKAIFFPIGGLVSISEDKSFSGMFQETPDVYACFAPVFGTVFFSDRKQVDSEMVGKINQDVQDQDADGLIKLSSSISLNFIVFRRDLDIFDWSDAEKNKFEQKLRAEVAKGNAEIYYDKGPVLALSLKSADPLVSVTGQNPPSIIYKEINPAEYEISVQNVNGDFKLDFNENFNSYWKLVDKDGFFTSVISSDESHSVRNGYANEYNISVPDLRTSQVLVTDKAGNQSAKFYVLFWPERWVPLAKFISCVTLLFVIFLAFFRKKLLVRNES